MKVENVSQEALLESLKPIGLFAEPVSQQQAGQKGRREEKE